MRPLLLCLPLLLLACTSDAEPASGGSATETAEAAADAVEEPESQATSEPTDDGPADPGTDERVVAGRTNVTSSGNRYLPGSLDLTSSPTTIEFPFVPVWLLPLDDGSLVGVAGDGASILVTVDGTMTELADVDPRVRPLAFRDDTTVYLVPANEGVDSDVPDATEVSVDDARAWFDGATDRLPHGALGDITESTRLVIERRVVGDPMDDAGDPVISEQRVVVDLGDDPNESVFEGLSPMLADVDGDGDVDVLATVSDGSTGARLVVFDMAGEQIATSEPIGRGNRWRHQIAVAPTDPNGGIDEVIEVETPHIGGVLQFRRFSDGELALQFQLGDFRSHALGSRNLDGAVVFDADGDGSPEVVVPTQDRASLAAVDSEPADAGPVLVDLAGATVSSNLALGQVSGALVFAVGLDDGRVLVWRA